MAHELLIALVDNNQSLFASSLAWPRTIESAVQGSVSKWSSLVGMVKLIHVALSSRAFNGRLIARLPFGTIDFPVNDMSKHCHTDTSYGTFDKDETQKLVEKSRREGVSVTSAISSAVLSAAGTLVSDPTGNLVHTIVADSRR